jgi:hypothetical protein
MPNAPGTPAAATSAASTSARPLCRICATHESGCGATAVKGLAGGWRRAGAPRLCLQARGAQRGARRGGRAARGGANEENVCVCARRSSARAAAKKDCASAKERSKLYGSAYRGQARTRARMHCFRRIDVFRAHTSPRHGSAETALRRSKSGTLAPNGHAPLMRLFVATGGNIRSHLRSIEWIPPAARARAPSAPPKLLACFPRRRRATASALPSRRRRRRRRRRLRRLRPRLRRRTPAVATPRRLLSARRWKPRCRLRWRPLTTSGPRWRLASTRRLRPRRPFSSRRAPTRWRARPSSAGCRRVRAHARARAAAAAGSGLAAMLRVTSTPSSSSPSRRSNRWPRSLTTKSTPRRRSARTRRSACAR